MKKILITVAVIIIIAAAAMWAVHSSDLIGALRRMHGG